jgi:hypothetical protein
MVTGIDHGRVNLRTNVPMAFGDAATQAAYEAQCTDARERQTVRFAVAPRQSVTTPSGHVHKAGEEISVAQLHGGQEAAWVILERWVASGVVLEASSPVLSPVDKSAKHRVASGGSIIVRAGILGPGRAVCAADLEGGQEALDDLVARGAVVAK